MLLMDGCPKSKKVVALSTDAANPINLYVQQN